MNLAIVGHKENKKEEEVRERLILAIQLHKIWFVVCHTMWLYVGGPKNWGRVLGPTHCNRTFLTSLEAHPSPVLLCQIWLCQIWLL